MSAHLEHMNTRLNAYSSTKVGSSNNTKAKPSGGVQFEIDQQSPKTFGKRKVSRGNITCHYFILYMHVSLLMVHVYILIISQTDFQLGRLTPKSMKSKIKSTPIKISQPTPQ